MEVSLYVNGSLIEVLIVVMGVFLKLMCIYEVINKSQYFLLGVVNANSLWINIEWEVVISLNAHEVVV